jgi:hypothetical protein
MECEVDALKYDGRGDRYTVAGEGGSQSVSFKLRPTMKRGSWRIGI